MRAHPASTRGVVVPFLPVAIVVVVILTYFLGWGVLAVVATLVVLATVWTWFRVR